MGSFFSNRESRLAPGSRQGRKTRLLFALYSQFVRRWRVFHKISRAAGPEQQTTKSDRLSYYYKIVAALRRGFWLSLARLRLGPVSLLDLFLYIGIFAGAGRD